MGKGLWDSLSGAISTITLCSEPPSRSRRRSQGLGGGLNPLGSKELSSRLVEAVRAQFWKLADLEKSEW